MYDHLWQLVIPFLRKLKIIITTPYVWDAKKRRFVLIENGAYLKRFKILSYILYAHMVIMTWNLFQVFKKEGNIIFQMTSLGTAAVTMFSTVNRRMHQNGAGAIVQLLNCMVAFEISSTERGNSYKLLSAKILYNVQCANECLFLNEHTPNQFYSFQSPEI
jgi:hypothetical protein